MFTEDAIFWLHEAEEFCFEAKHTIQFMIQEIKNVMHTEMMKLKSV
jgi:hypothetical protein